ncbi:MAG: aldehyde dehydrogenase family protein, partial [Pseudomonadota bacterium]
MLEQAEIDRLRDAVVPPQGHVIEGRRDPAQGGEELDVINPADGSTITTIARGTKADVGRAVASARAAFADGRWSRMPPAARM